jgi:hypothetical protein
MAHSIGESNGQVSARHFIASLLLYCSFVMLLIEGPVLDRRSLVASRRRNVRRAEGSNFPPSLISSGMPRARSLS